MTRKEWLYGLVAADAVLAFATIGAESVLHKFLPAPLREHQARSWLETDWSFGAVAELAIWVAERGRSSSLAWIALATFNGGRASSTSPPGRSPRSRSRCADPRCSRRREACSTPSERW